MECGIVLYELSLETDHRVIEALQKDVSGVYLFPQRLI